MTPAGRILGRMADETKTDPAPRGPESHAETPPASPNGKATARIRRPAAAEPAPAAAASEPCEDCPPARDYSGVLGWLMVGAALALLAIGADLASRGALSRRLGAGAWDDEPQ